MQCSKHYIPTVSNIQKQPTRSRPIYHSKDIYNFATQVILNEGPAALHIYLLLKFLRTFLVFPLPDQDEPDPPPLFPDLPLPEDHDEELEDDPHSGFPHPASSE